MTTKEQVQRENKSNGLKVFKTADNQYYVESSEGKIAYRVSGSNGTKSCSCGDYTNKIEKDPSFQCKHILAVINGNGNIRNIEVTQNQSPKLDDRFIIEIKRKDTVKEFVLYAGLLDLAHQKGIRKMLVEAIQYPTKDNKQEAICKATVESNDGEIFTELADANPLNVNRMVVEHMLRVAATRAKARALRDFTNIGMTCLEELGDLDEAMEDESGKSKTRPRREAKAETVNTEKKIQAPPKQELQKGGSGSDEQRSKTNQQAKKEPVKPTGVNTSEKKEDKKTADTKGEEGKINPSEAQIKAIEKLAERRGINGEQIVKIFTDKYKKPYEQINASEAKEFIRHLQQAA
jgi:predicted nucleic acid-binding Zn finger protein